MTIKEYVQLTGPRMLELRRANEGNFCSTFLFLNEQHWEKGCRDSCPEAAPMSDLHLFALMEQELEYIKTSEILTNIINSKS